MQRAALASVQQELSSSDEFWWKRVQQRVLHMTGPIVKQVSWLCCKSAPQPAACSQALQPSRQVLEAHGLLLS
jgi:hypothetical protein